jgi:hypothetical protein
MHIVVLIGHMVLALAGAALAIASDSTLVDFALEDQFEQVHRRADFAGKILIVVGSDADGSSFNERWSKAIYDSLRDEPVIERIAIIGLADTRSAPSFMRWYVRRHFPNDRRKPVMLDWDGVFAERYDFVPGSCNILVFTPAYRLVHRAHGRELEPGKLGAIVESVRGVTVGSSGADDTERTD